MASQWNWSIALLVLASVFLYAGGVVLNDVFDYELDKLERPERPIPSGAVPLKAARLFGFLLLFLGILLAGLVHYYGLLIALVLGISIVTYDYYSKKSPFLGPLNMGVCRGLNLLLGISILQDFSHWKYVVVPIVFIFAVTLISRGEVHGQNKKNILFAGFLYVLVIFFVVILHKAHQASQMTYLFFLVLFTSMVFLPLIKAYKNNVPRNVMGAVKAGVLSIILLDAALAVAHSDWYIGLLILMLLPISSILAKVFAVT